MRPWNGHRALLKHEGQKCFSRIRILSPSVEWEPWPIYVLTKQAVTLQLYNTIILPRSVYGTGKNTVYFWKKEDVTEPGNYTFLKQLKAVESNH